MKQIARMPIIKFVVFILCAACVGVSSHMVLNQILSQEGVDPEYFFEATYKNSNQAQVYIKNAVRSIYKILQDKIENPDVKSPAEYYLNNGDYEVEYYAQSGDIVLTNTDQTDLSYYQQGAVYMIHDKQDGNVLNEGVSWSLNSNQEGPEQFKIYVKINDAYAAQQEALYSRLHEEASKVLNYVIGMMILFVLGVVYLAWVTGKNKEDEEIHLVLIDRAYVEFTLAAIVGTIIATLAAVFAMLSEMSYNQILVFGRFIPLVLSLGCAAELELFLSLIRNAKNRTFLQRSVIYKVLHFVWNLVKKIFRFGWELLKKIVRAFGRLKDELISLFSRHFSERKLLGLFVLYSVAIAFLAMFFVLVIDSGISIFLFLLGVVGLIGAVLFVGKRMRGFDQIRNKIRQMRNGNLHATAEEYPDGVMSEIAEDLNKIEDGLRASLEREVQAERMKSELITNVSHDLKTPLTSIINYADLLSKEHLSPEEANDYVKIIQQKGERLKNLTADLFDISRVQSGVEQMRMEKLDVVLLIKQSLAELDEQIKVSELEFITSLPEHEIDIMADGKKMSRVFENLLGNILKYAMKHTRVYIDVKKREEEVLIVFKNIANYSMNFNEKEILERFVRGDASRSTEGNGLGLAIAQSYTVACGGKLAVTADGDLFKATILFPVV